MKQKTARPDGELVYGINPLVELIQAKRRKLLAIYTTKPTPKSWDKIERLIAGKGIQISYVDRDVLTRMAGTPDHQGVVAWAQPFIYRKKPFDTERQKRIVLLDGIQDPRNVGAILRSIYCTGFDGVIIPVRGAAPVNATALKSSAGLAEHLEIYCPPSSQAAVQELEKAGYSIYLALFNGQSATSVSYQAPLCVVIGSEGAGISPALVKKGIPVTLPQINATVSYNASVAAGILLFLVATQQGAIKQ